MESKISDLKTNKENDKNTVNKSDELEELRDSVKHFKKQNTAINSMENISTLCTETSNSQNCSETDLISTNEAININKQYCNTNYIRNKPDIQDQAQEDSKKCVIGFSNETNDGIAKDSFEPCEDDNTSENSMKKIFNTQNSSDNELLTRKKPTTVIDSDNEIDDHKLCKRKTFRHHKKPTIFDSDSDEDLSNEHPNNEKQATTDIRSRSLAICDSESSDDEKSDNCEDYSGPLIETTTIKNNSKMTKVIPSSQDKKITGRDAAKLRKEITSESQRMTRECAVNLPYHKPKVRTLKEFLQNRPRFATTVPASTSNTPPSLAIKMLSEHLQIISEKLSKREKEVKQFFKSESESEEESENINEEIKEQNEITTLETSEKFEHNPRKDSENAHEETIEQNVKVSGEIFEINEERNQPATESTVTILQNILLNSNRNVESADDKMQQTNFQQSNQAEQEQVDVQASVEGKTCDAETFETQIPQTIIKSNEGHENTTSNNPDSPQYEFTMADVSSEDDENDVELPNSETDKLDKLIDKYTSEEIINIPANTEGPNKEDMLGEQSNNKSRLNLIKEFSSIKPELKGSPGLVIDLEDGSTKLNEVSQLMDRFLRHNRKKTPQKSKLKLDIISVSSGEIHKETVEVPIHDEETIAINEKPGERLKKFRNELETQMAKRRSQLWQQKSNLKAESEETEEKSEADIEHKAEDDILDDEDEGEFTNSEDDEEEDIIGGGDDDYDEIDDEGGPKKKSVFLDEEAEESDADNNDDGNSVNDEEDLIENNEVCHDEAIDDNADESSEQSPTDHADKQKKKLKRIIKPFSNDSDDEDSSLDNYADSKIEKVAFHSIDHENNKEYVLDSTDTWDDSNPTPHQPRNSRTPSKKQTQSKSELGFLTPVVQLTGLQSLNSGSKFLHESPITPFVMPADSPTKSFKQNGPQKRLFTDTDLTTTQDLSEVADLCSGKFPSQTQDSSETDTMRTTSGNNIRTSDDSAKDTPIQEEPSTQDLLEVCSGKFTDFTLPDKMKTNDEMNQNDDVNPTSDCIDNSKPTLNLTEISINNNEVKNLDSEDKLISQLLNEEEMETFKRKFDSPLNENDSSLTSFPRVIYDSSDDENFSNVRKPKKQKKLVFSDDECSNDCAEEVTLESNEEIDLCDYVDEEEDIQDDELPEDVEYDSEENEISVNAEETKKKIKIADFLENEAELSESDWESADEDERGLDEFEIEEGDKEKLDEDKIKMDLERIHIRRILDDDNQEVKLLQELLLDDGELHGTGRERQFRWKNIDSIGNDLGAPQQNEGELYLDDENEDEERWRKMRYEREEFLKKQLEKTELLNTAEDDAVVKTNSQVFKLGQKALKRQISITQNSSITLEKKLPLPSPEVKETISLLCKRGSFLTRSDQVLARVAEFTKTITAGVGGVKNSKRFVFQTVSESENAIGLGNKRKATEGTPKAIKRLRLNNLSPAVQKNGRKSGQAI